jgi:hypothetical protein
MSTYLRELVERFKLDAEKPLRNYAQGSGSKGPAPHPTTRSRRKKELEAQYEPHKEDRGKDSQLFLG